MENEMSENELGFGTPAKWLLWNAQKRSIKENVSEKIHYYTYVLAMNLV